MHPKLKYCGNHSLRDVQLTRNTHADYIGFIFTCKSRRTVKPEQVADWLKQCEMDESKKIVGVFADDSAEFIEAVARKIPLDVVQLHGSESPSDTALIKQLTGLKVWKALHHDRDTLEEMRRFRGVADGFVIDTKISGHLGGTGISFDWSSVPQYVDEAGHQRVDCLIAGGIRPENIDSLLHYKPTGIDISSGIETDFHKNRKQIQKIEAKVLGINDQTTTN